MMGLNKELLEIEKENIDKNLGYSLSKSIKNSIFLSNFKQKYFGNYLLADLIACGGMAEIYKSYCKLDNKKVVIKKILPEYANNFEFIKMFLDEARILAQLLHENIVRITDFGKIEDDYFMALDYIEGRSLKIILDRAFKLKKPFPIELAIYITTKILSGLDYAHNKKGSMGNNLNIIHRDMSPDNVLISDNGEVKILDFGIAKASINSSVTRIGQLKGKWGYMAPEQILKESIDARTDVYSAGVILYELLTCEKAVKLNGDTSVRKNIKKLKIERISKLNPSIPKELEAIINKALEKKIKNRYFSANDFQTALIGFLTGDVYHSIQAYDLVDFIFELFPEDKAKHITLVESKENIINLKTANTGIITNETLEQTHIVKRPCANNTNALLEIARDNTATKYKYTKKPKLKKKLIVFLLIIGIVGILFKYKENILNNSFLQTKLLQSDIFKFINDNYHVNLGKYYFKKGDYERALYEFTEIGNKHTQVYNQSLALIFDTLQKINNPELTLKFLTHYAKNNMLFPLGYKRMGNIYLLNGDKENALRFFKAYNLLEQNENEKEEISQIIEKLEPKETPQISYEEPKIVKQEPIRKKAIKQKSNHDQFASYVLKGDKSYNEDDFENAIKFYEKAIALNNKNYATPLKLARSYSRLIEYEYAIKFYKKTIVLSPKNKDALMELGLVYYETGEIENAQKYLNKYLKEETSKSKKAKIEQILNVM
jgi:serine/threonine protein kinase